MYTITSSKMSLLNSGDCKNFPMPIKIPMLLDADSLAPRRASSLAWFIIPDGGRNGICTSR